MTTAPSDASVAPPTARGSPFVGLENYRERDAAFFFGREREQRIITANLRSSRLTLLYGASGVGKSSVLRAGVVHELRRRVADQCSTREAGAGTTDGPIPFAVTYFNRWQDRRPLPALLTAIHGSVSEALGEPEPEPWRPGATAAEDFNAWTARVRSLYVVLDQFEEYFLYPELEDVPETFATEFARIVNDARVRVNFLVSLREDAWPRLDRFKAAIPDLFANYLRLDYLGVEGGRRAIERSITAYNDLQGSAYVIDAELTDAVLESVQTSDTTGGDGRYVETPILQLVMQRLWSETVERGSDRLELATLGRLGGSREILRRHLEDALAALDADEQATAAAVFRFLVTSSKTKIAQSATVLADWSELPRERVLATLEHLTAGTGRVLRPLAPLPGETSPRYEIFHDVLAEPILEWREGYEREREAETLTAKLVEDERRRMEEQSADHTRQVNRIVRWSAALLLVLSTALAVAVVVVIRQRSEVKSQRDAASAQALLDVDPQRSLKLALGAMRTRHTAEAETALREALGTSHVRDVADGAAKQPLTGAVTSADGAVVAARGADAVQLHSTADGRALGRPLRPGGDITGVALSANGAVAAVAAGKGAQFVRLRAGRPVTLQGQRSPKAVAVSDDGEYVATGGDGTGVTIFSTSDPNHPRHLAEPASVDDLQFDPADANTLAIASCRGGVWLWRSGVLKRLPGSHGDACFVSFSPDGRYLAGPARPRVVRIWDTARGTTVTDLLNPQEDLTSDSLKILPARSAVAWSRDGNQIAVVDHNAASLWPVKADSSEPAYFARADDTYAVAFSPDGKLLATGSQDGTAQVWEIGSQTVLAELLGHVDSVTAISFADNEHVITASRDRTVRRWNTGTGIALRETSLVDGAAYSPDGKRVVTVVAGDESTTPRARVWDVATSDRVKLGAAGTMDRLLTAEFDHSGKEILLAGERDGQLLFGRADARTGLTTAERTLGEIDKPEAAHFSPDGNSVIVASAAQGPLIWDVGSGSDAPPRAVPGGRASEARWSPDGELILTAGIDGIARLFDARTLKARGSLQGGAGKLTGSVFSDDGKRIVTFGFDRIARVWTVTGAKLAELTGHTSWLTAAAFSPDGTRVVTAGRDLTLRTWDADTGQLLAVARPHADIIRSVAMSPDGRQTLSASDDKTAKVNPAAAVSSIKKLLDEADRRARAG